MLKRITQEELDRKIDAFAGGLGYDPDSQLPAAEAAGLWAIFRRNHNLPGYSRLAHVPKDHAWRPTN